MTTARCARHPIGSHSKSTAIKALSAIERIVWGDNHNRDAVGNEACAKELLAWWQMMNQVHVRTVRTEGAATSHVTGACKIV